MLSAFIVVVVAIVVARDDDNRSSIGVATPADGAVTNDPTPRFTGEADGAESVVVSVLAGRKTVATTSARVDSSGSFSATLARPLAAGSYTARIRELAHSGEVVGEARRRFVRWNLGSGRVALGTLGGGARPGRPGPFGLPTAVEFDGAGSFVTVPPSPALDARGGVTVGTWLAREGSQHWQVLVGKPGDGRSKLENYSLWLNASDHVVAFFGDGTRYVRVETPGALDSDWHLVVATYDGVTAVIYLDGISVATTRQRLHLTPNGGNLNIGRARDDSSYFWGRLDRVVVLDSALPAAGVRRLYKEAAVGDQEPPRLTLTTPARGTSTRDTRAAFAGMAATTLLDRKQIAVKIWKGGRPLGKPVGSAHGAVLPSGTWGARPNVALQPGVYTARAEQRDHAGNRGLSTPSTFTVRSGEPGAGTSVLAAGDIVDCSGDGDEQTAALLDRLPGLVLTLGDHAYDWGTREEFTNCYGPSWGRFRERTRPTIGGHEYGDGGGDASTYYRYFHAQLAPFGASAVDQRRGWYSYDLGGWHVVSLNTSWREVGLPTAGSKQVRWLRADLAAHRRQCTLALWHDPVFSSGLNGGSFSYRPLWDALYAAGAELVLNGHDHDYERFAPQDPSGGYNPARGIREIVVGTGGFSHYSFSDGKGILANSEVRNDRTFGVLRLTLRPRSYEWQFVPAGGASFTDAGSARCH